MLALVLTAMFAALAGFILAGLLLGNSVDETEMLARRLAAELAEAHAAFTSGPVGKDGSELARRIQDLLRKLGEVEVGRRHLEEQIGPLAVILNDRFGGPVRKDESACERAARLLMDQQAQLHVLMAGKGGIRSALPRVNVTPLAKPKDPAA